MGQFATKPWQDSEGDACRYMVIWGKVVKDPEIGATQKRGLPRVRFTVTWARKEYMICDAVGDNAVTRMASCLEQGDYVMVAGTYSEHVYVSKKDNTSAVWRSIKADMVIPQPEPQASAGAADAFETTPEDYEDDYELNM